MLSLDEGKKRISQLIKSNLWLKEELCKKKGIQEDEIK